LYPDGNSFMIKNEIINLIKDRRARVGVIGLGYVGLPLATEFAGKGFKATGHLAVGEPVEEICRAAKDTGVDLIVIGHNQSTSWAARWWKGSVGASLLDYAPCSILIALSKA